MKFSPRLVRLLAAASVVALASCASQPPPPPLPPVVLPPAAPPPPPVALSGSVLEAAGAYRLYIRRAAEISPAFANGDAVEQSLVAAASYEPKQFLRGAIAYAALVALQSPQFVAGVRTFAVDPAGRADLAAKLMADPYYAAALPSSAAAATLVSATLHADADKVRRAGELVKQAAYDVQHQAWSKGDIPARDLRLANAKTVSGVPISPPPADVQLLKASITGVDTSGLTLAEPVGDPLTAPFSAVVSRGLAVAALAALGEGGEANDAALSHMLDDTTNAFCLNLAKLNLYQCLSVAKPYYEDVFCIGQHILLDTAQCVSKAAGGNVVVVAEAAPPPLSPTAQPYKPTPPAKKPVARKPAAKK
ncbi:MAG TPA: hypothetical protein VL460_08320 [Caulobacteraceae bacterium]|jgi:hypothetical protein|nr:hypothetical protein [Caulobacteraceae bacterium]